MFRLAFPVRSVPSFSTPSWATPWRRHRRPGAGRTGPAIAVVGNCQARVLAETLRVLLPSARVETVSLATLGREFDGFERLLAHLSGFDHVFSHFFGDGFVTGGNAYLLKQRMPQIRLVPTITFPAFHPDMVIVGNVDALRLSKLIRSPIGHSHSAIALWGFLEGLSVDDTLSLFTEPVFEQLGYYALWDEGAEFLLRNAHGLSFDLSREFTLWSRRGCFMHDVNHPKLHVLADIARRLAAETGLAPLDVAVEDYLPDMLLEEGCWPVYPEVARHYGVPAAGLFRTTGVGGKLPRLMDLPSFVGESFALYREQGAGALACGRVDAWRADARIEALFASARRA